MSTTTALAWGLVIVPTAVVIALPKVLRATLTTPSQNHPGNWFAVLMAYIMMPVFAIPGLVAIYSHAYVATVMNGTTLSKLWTTGFAIGCGILASVWLLSLIAAVRVWQGYSHEPFYEG